MSKRQRGKRKKIEKEEEVITKDNITNKVFIALVILCIIGLFYLLTLYITNKHSTTKTEDTKKAEEVSTSYDKIVIGKTFSMESNDYLVLFYDASNNEISNTYSELLTNYKAKEGHLPIYYVDMSTSFNKKFTTTKEANHNPTDASEILVNGPTLIRISNNSVSNYIEGKDKITEYLK